jgi:protein arginine kinase activator
MLCQSCKKKKATLFFKHVSEGGIKELSLCKDCAAEQGFETDSPESIAEMLFGMDSQGQGNAPFVSNKQCSVCGLKAGQFRNESRLGCASCYGTFEDELGMIFADIQEGNYHTGKTPADVKSRQRITWLKDELQHSVEIQDFEEAAKIRDLLVELEGERGAESGS